MKAVVLGDLHLISPQEDAERRAKRDFFAAGWPSFRALAAKVREESPDLVISLGDLVDWYSEVNVQFALNLMEELRCKWVMAPGNHDLERSDVAAGEERAAWTRAGIELNHRVIEADGFRLLIMDSALSHLPEGTREWFAGAMTDGRPALLFTHVPLRFAEVQQFIHGVDPRRNLDKYMQRSELFAAGEARPLQAAFTAHLHFPGRVDIGTTQLRMLPLSLASVGRVFPSQGTATVLEMGQGRWATRELSVES